MILSDVKGTLIENYGLSQSGAVYKVPCAFENEAVTIQHIFAARESIGDDVEFAIKQLDFLISSCCGRIIASIGKFFC